VLAPRAEAGARCALAAVRLVERLVRRSVEERATLEEFLPQEKDSNDPSAGSPTETLLRLLLPLNDRVWACFQSRRPDEPAATPVPRPHSIIQSVVATGGVYKGQGRNQREVMTRAYWEFLVHGQ
jgi:hypothetical protein